MLTGTDEKVILAIEQEIRERLDTMNHSSGKPYRAECSMGHYMTPISARESFEECMRLSDIEMYKVSGMNGPAAPKDPEKKRP